MRTGASLAETWVPVLLTLKPIQRQQSLPKAQERCWRGFLQPETGLVWSIPVRPTQETAQARVRERVARRKRRGVRVRPRRTIWSCSMGEKESRTWSKRSGLRW